MKIKLFRRIILDTSNRLFGVILLALFLTPSFCIADPNIIEEPNSITPATVAQWSKPSFSIEIKNTDAEDIRLSTDTKLRFGMGTGHAYTNWEWNAINENLCWVNLTGEVTIASGGTATLTFEKALVCGDLPADVYHPQLVLEGTYVGSGTPFSFTLNTQANPITVTYYERDWSYSCGLGPANSREVLFTSNGGYCHFPYPNSQYLELLTWLASTRDNLPVRFVWRIGESAGTEARNYRVDLRTISSDCSIISQEAGPPQKFTTLVDNHDYQKLCRIQIAAYMNDMTVPGEKYSAYYYVFAWHTRCPHQTGFPVFPGAAWKMDVVFDDVLSCDISGLTGPTLDVYQNEAFDVNVSITNPEEYKIVLSREPPKTYLAFTSDGNDVSNSFIVIPPYSSDWTADFPEIADVIDSNQTKTFTFKVIPKGSGHVCDDINWVYVGDAGNPNDVTGYGSVPFTYYISRYEITNAQYCHFLNSVDPEGTSTYQLYDGSMAESLRGGIILDCTASLGVRYRVKGGYANHPVNYVSWQNAARFCNWLSSGDTETGCYNTSDWSYEPNNGSYWIPTEDEWYKAAYYSGSGNTYYIYATQSNDIPTAAISDSNGRVSNPGTNVANYGSGFDWPIGVNGNVSIIGDCGSSSHYGTFDQSGNVAEWVCREGPDGLIPVGRGGSCNYSHDSMRADCSGEGGGFRVASSDINPTRLVFAPSVQGQITITPTIYCYNYFTEGNDVVEIGASQSGTSYLAVNLNPDRDRDDDGLYNDDEVNIYGTNPDNPDTDGDGMPDGWEVKSALNPLVNDAVGDYDSDNISNLEECYLGTDPNDSNQPTIVYVDCNNTSGTEDGSPDYPYNTIQEGIDSRTEPVVIKVSPGTYNERICLRDKLILEGAGPQLTIIDANAQGTVVSAGGVSWGRITGFTITNGYGVGINCSRSCLVISRNVIRNNYCSVWGCGGGIVCAGYARSQTIISENIISNNTAEWYGGGIYICYGSNPLIINNIITNNRNRPIQVFYSGCPNIVNNTIVHNRYGIWSWDASALITNCILWENGTNLDGCLATYSNIQGGAPGIGNIDVDPCFASPGYMHDNNTPEDANDDFWVDGDYHLLSESQCIDAGDPNYVHLPNETDIDGRPRIVDGDCNGTEIIDMGAYEFSYAYIGDFDGQCDVDLKDFAILALAWLTDEGEDGWNPICDIGMPADNSVNILDLAVLSRYWLEGTTP
jgi:parallel beta-helix repeat protein